MNNEDNLALYFNKCFCRPEGRVVLEHLSKITIERVLAPSASSGELYYLEGQRALLALIKNLVRAGGR